MDVTKGTCHTGEDAASTRATRASVTRFALGAWAMDLHGLRFDFFREVCPVRFACVVLWRVHAVLQECLAVDFPQFALHVRGTCGSDRHVEFPKQAL
jgi:hypothetical protein